MLVLKYGLINSKDGLIILKMDCFFKYDKEQLAFLRKRDKRLGEVIERLGRIERRVVPDLFCALVHSIVGQQISTKAHESIWRRMNEGIGEITPASVLALSREDLQRFGISFRKADYIRAAAQKIESGLLDIQALGQMSDEEVCQKLTELDGVGLWTAEMLMLHSLQRPDILSFGDLGIQRGMRMLYHHRKITRGLFERYRRRYSPYGSVASIYLWAISAGEVEGMKDYAPKETKKVLGVKNKKKEIKKDTSCK